uniref:Uncharacterized protein n=1 Tax=Alexandrium monilatum TaxID=311494 RepID=A0A7S4VE06_9DINO
MVPWPKWCPATPAASGADAASGPPSATAGPSRRGGQAPDASLLLQELARDVDLLCLRVNAWEFRIKHIRELTAKLHKRMPSLKLQAEANANKSRFRDLAGRCGGVLQVACAKHGQAVIDLQDEVHALHSQVRRLVDGRSDRALEDSEDSAALAVGQQARQAAAPPVGPAGSDVRPPRIAGRGGQPAPAESSRPSSSSGGRGGQPAPAESSPPSSSSGGRGGQPAPAENSPPSSSSGGRGSQPAPAERSPPSSSSGGRGSRPAPAERYPPSSSSGGRGSQPAPAESSPPSSSSGGGISHPAAAGRAAPSCESGSADRGPADADVIMTRWGQTILCDGAAPALHHPTPPAEEAAPTLRHLPPPVDEAAAPQWEPSGA